LREGETVNKRIAVNIFFQEAVDLLLRESSIQTLAPQSVLASSRIVQYGIAQDAIEDQGDSNGKDQSNSK
jgi:hypothetical protein